MKYRKVVINGEIIAGEDVIRVYPPSNTDPVWSIILKNKIEGSGIRDTSKEPRHDILVYATGNVSMWEREGEEK